MRQGHRRLTFIGIGVLVIGVTVFPMWAVISMIMCVFAGTLLSDVHSRRDR